MSYQSRLNCSPMVGMVRWCEIRRVVNRSRGCGLSWSQVVRRYEYEMYDVGEYRDSSFMCSVIVSCVENTLYEVRDILSSSAGHAYFVETGPYKAYLEK